MKSTVLLALAQSMAVFANLPLQPKGKLLSHNVNLRNHGTQMAIAAALKIGDGDGGSSKPPSLNRVGNIREDLEDGGVEQMPSASTKSLTLDCIGNI